MNHEPSMAQIQNRLQVNIKIRTKIVLKKMKGIRTVFKPGETSKWGAAYVLHEYDQERR